MNATELWMAVKQLQEEQCLQMACEAYRSGWVEMRDDCLERAAMFRREARTTIRKEWKAPP
jgi:hypothetical protein